MPFDSKFHADEILQNNQWNPKSVILKNVTKMDQKEAIW